MKLLRSITTAGLACALVLVGTPALATTEIDVGGAVAAPAEYAPWQLAGQSLYDVVERAAPVLPPGKNTGLRVVVRVTGSHGRSATFALGELDPSFGAHAAVFSGDGLTVPGDRDRSRSVPGVRSVRVSVSDAVAQDVAAGAVRVVTGHRTATVPAWVLSHLPRRTVQVTFASADGVQTHTESGPPLSAVLLAAGVIPTAGTPVTAVGDDGYGAVVTPAEDYVGGRPLLLSVAEDGVALDRPRLVPDGDVKGGRYVSGTVVLAIG